MIELINVHKTLGYKEILCGINLRVARGKTLVIVGASGTGKSVTLKHIIGLMRPDEGQVLVDGEDICQARGRDLERLRRKFGVLFQSGALIAWMTVAQNVALPLYENTTLGDADIRRRVCEMLAQVHLEGSEEKRPAEISGGMKKRAALARALIMEPQILLYDEPTAGLDPVMSRHVDQMIRDTQQQLGVTSVVVTHDLHSAFTVGDEVAMLYEGVVAECAPPAAFVRSQHAFVQEFIRAQFASGIVEGVLR